MRRLEDHSLAGLESVQNKNGYGQEKEDEKVSLDSRYPSSEETSPRRLRLYIAGETPNSVRAQKNLRQVLNQLGRSCYTVEVIDVFKAPQRALEDRVIVTPTLLYCAVQPPRRLVGNLSDGRALEAFLEL
ncbi:circadian clock KaiB family protein [Nitrosococcus wardiae]|nr:circadian clock KaiB family protein [Nitrosococcus wardiae]